MKLRSALAQFATGVAVITTVTSDNANVGLTVNSFSSVSLSPPLVLWSLAKKSQNLKLFEERHAFAVNVLTTAQVEVSNRFARAVDDRFRDIDWKPGIDAVPLISGCVATFECRTRHIIDAGDHKIFIGEVVRFNSDSAEPLLFLNSRYHRAIPLV
ncbi:flavin reductase family protein [Pusillimonas sp. DMV24BSW_D]|nr:flavin reductase family protein [Pusillimonas sp. DMV24BSW_D]